MINKLLNTMIVCAKRNDCCVFHMLNEYDGLGYVECNGECFSCERRTIERIEKIRKEIDASKVKVTLKHPFEVFNGVLFHAEPSIEVKEPKQAISDKTSDNVNHPSHYKLHKHECIDEMVAVFGVDAVKHFCACNAWKYRYRADAKNGEEDLEKADWYIEKLMELEGESS